LVDVLYRLSDLTAEGSLSDLLPDYWQKSPQPPTEVAALIANRKQGNTGFASMEPYIPSSAKTLNS
jgi:hypothetical protein